MDDYDRRTFQTKFGQPGTQDIDSGTLFDTKDVVQASSEGPELGYR